MSWSPEPYFPARTALIVAGLVLMLLQALPAGADEARWEDGAEIWLVTYGPGQIYWQRFGHNAIWVRDGELGLDHVFNFGFFDFAQEDFFLRFLQGRMLYFSAAQPAREEFAGYIDENRSIRAQKLDLSAEQKMELIDFLVREVRPGNRDYLYDYYLNNCSTRVRDAIDRALGGLLQAEFQPLSSNTSWRDHTRRLTEEDFWLYLGLEIGLGSPVDREISLWETMFIPAELADLVAQVRFSGGETPRPLVIEDVILFESSLAPPSSAPTPVWPRYLMASLAGLLCAWLLRRLVSPAVAARAWLFLSGLAGMALLFFWAGTDHAVARLNLNLLVLNPLWLLLAAWKGLWKFGFGLTATFAGLALAMMFVPPGQYVGDVLAAFLPINLAAGWVLFRYRPRPTDLPGVPAAKGL
jgi:hypothetical protein